MKKVLLILFCFPTFILSQNIGDFHQGGIVFYLDNSAIIQKGLIVDTAYLDATYSWSLQDSLISDWGPNLHYCSGTENKLIGGGQQNTDIFEIDHPSGNYAANLCFHSVSGGFSDWFLPSIDELWQLMLNINTIDSAINIYGGDIIQANFHWSSTQVLVDSLGGDIRYAYSASPYSNMGPYITIKSKNTAHLVRSIRCIDNDCSFLVPTLIADVKTKKEILKITDLLGRETKGQKNQPLFYLYDDGTVEKRIIID
tara:strand:+ start:472 stop:1236 length:765 start_codon:yes stop_codon:yes gene_type:complete